MITFDHWVNRLSKHLRSAWSVNNRFGVGWIACLNKQTDIVLFLFKQTDLELPTGLDCLKPNE